MKAADKALQSIKQFSGKDFYMINYLLPICRWRNVSRSLLFFKRRGYTKWQNPNYDVYANTEMTN